MFDRVALQASDPAATQALLDAVLPRLGREAPASELVVVPAAEGGPTTQRLHVGLAAASTAHVDAAWQAAIDAGFTSDGEPGPRPAYAAAGYYGGFLLDPDGNSIEAAWHERLRPAGVIDHLWVRVQHVGLTTRFYEATAAQAGPGDGKPGYELVETEELLARFRGPAGGSLTLVHGPDPTAGLDVTIGGARFVDDSGLNLHLRASG